MKPNKIKKSLSEKNKSKKKNEKKVEASRLQTLVRRPLFWILVGILLVSVFGRISSSNQGFTRVDTSTILAAISKGEVESATIIDRDQLIRAVLKPGQLIADSVKIESFYLSGQEALVIELITSNPPPKPWNVEVPRQNLFLSFIFSLLPLLLI